MTSEFRAGEAPAGGIPPEWCDAAAAFMAESTATAVGLFGADGSAVYLNAGMRYLLGGGGVEGFLNPTFHSLVDREPGDRPVFEGVMTLGGAGAALRSIRAKVYLRDGRIFVVGEYDALELDRLNRELAGANQRINNLQRELLKEKASLERTLAELKETQALLVHSEKMNAMGQLVAGVAHEINNPIAYVFSNVHSLREAFTEISAAYEALEGLVRDRGGPEADAALGSIREAHDIDFLFEDLGDLHAATMDGLDRVRRIVEDLRRFSRLDEAERKTVDLTENLGSTLAVAGPDLKKRGVETILSPAGPLIADCFPTQLNQVFLNLMLNAAQAMADGGTLAIEGAGTEEGVVLRFSDTGPGIPPEIRGKIFDPFFTTKPVGQGTGLGLSLAYKIVTDLHGGRIAVDCPAGGGTVFTLRIPGRIDATGSGDTPKKKEIH